MRSSGKILLILDVDETLLFASEQPLEHKADYEVGPYFVYRRPYLSEFILTCQRHFEMAVWSSSSADYLGAVIASIFPAGAELAFVWSRDRCIRRYDPEWQTFYFVKDLKKVKQKGFDLNRVLIVEDTPKKVERNYGNAVYVKPFFGDENDDELRRLSAYLESLASEANLRTVEKRNWKSRY